MAGLVLQIRVIKTKSCCDESKASTLPKNRRYVVMHRDSAQQPAQRKSDSRVAGSGDGVDKELVLTGAGAEKAHPVGLSGVLLGFKQPH